MRQARPPAAPPAVACVRLSSPISSSDELATHSNPLQRGPWLPRALLSASGLRAGMSAGKPVRRAATAAAALDQATPAPRAPSQAGHLRGWPVAVCGSTPGPGVTFRRIPVLLRHHPARAGKPPAGTTTALVSNTVWFGLCPAFPLVYVSYSGSRQAARSAMQDPAVRCPPLLLGPSSIGAAAPSLAYALGRGRDAGSRCCYCAPYGRIRPWYRH